MRRSRGTDDPGLPRLRPPRACPCRRRAARIPLLRARRHSAAARAEPDEAQIEADRARLRPILMTTLAIVFGMLPVALGRGDGSASRAALAIAVVGGQALCLVVTLVITPVVYSFFDDLRGWPQRLLAWRPAWRPRLSLGRRLEAGFNGRWEA